MDKQEAVELIKKIQDIELCECCSEKNLCEKRIYYINGLSYQINFCSDFEEK